MEYPTPHPTPHPAPHAPPHLALPRILPRTHPATNAAALARFLSPYPAPLLARCPCPYTVEPCTVEALCTPLEQLWAGEIPRLEAEKRAAKQVGCMTREDKDSYGEARHSTANMYIHGEA